MPRFHKNKLLKDPIFRNKITDKRTNQITEKKIGNLGAIGYFQMWHSSSRLFYEEKSKTGEIDDIEFMLSFKPSHPKKLRRKLDDITDRMSRCKWLSGSL